MYLLLIITIIMEMTDEYKKSNFSDNQLNAVIDYEDKSLS